jgi:GT2 family glycosyltransferase
VAAFETIVVIDHNTTLEKRVSAAYRDVRTISNSGRRGLSAARNTGVRRARGTIVAFLDDDAVADPGWLGRMLGHYADPAVIGVGGRVMPLWPGQCPRWFPPEFNWVVGCSYVGQPERLAAVRNPIGCNMSFRLALFERLGGFREGIGREGGDGAGCEETEFCIRARQAYPESILIYDPDMVVHHRLSPERATWRYFRARCRAEGRSKAAVVRHVGARDGLSSERQYALRVLPAAAIRGLRDAGLSFDLWGLARAGTIVAGFAYTAGSYLAARCGVRSSHRAEQQVYLPIQVLDLDLAPSPPRIHARSQSNGHRYSRAFCLLRFAGRPIGIQEISLDREDSSLADLKASLALTLRRSASPVVPLGHRDSPFISIIVATRDRSRSLAACLDSLLRQDYPTFEVVVVDNAPSSQETADLVARRYAPTGRVRYVREDKPGLGQAHNCGLATIAAPVVAFTDDDVIVDSHWLTVLAAHFASNSRIACVTGLILPAELETRAQYWAERHGGFGKGFERKLYDLGGHRPPSRLYPYAAGQFGSGANMAFRTDALRRIGGFDPALGAGTPARGGDDLAVFFEVIQAGYQLVYEPEAIVWHHHRRDETGMRRQAFGYGVGLGAYLTKIVFDRPASLLQLAIAFPAGLAHIFGASSPKNERLADDYPTALVWRERFGILAGVPLYLLSRAVRPRSRDDSVSVSPSSFSPASTRRQ